MKTIEASTRIDLETPIINLKDWVSINSKGTSTINVTTLNATNVNALGGVQPTAVAVTATATNWAPIPAGSTFVSVTSSNIAHIVDLPTPVLWNIIYIKEVGTTGFELAPAANTQFINGTECTVAKSLLIAGGTGVVVCVCVVWWAAWKWTIYYLDDDGTVDAGWTPD
jgi:hypothetical protein